MRVTAALSAALASALALAACGSSTKTFSDHRMAITFTYPSALSSGTITSVAIHIGARSSGVRKAVGIDHDNALLVTKYTLKVPSTKADIPELERATDEVVSALYHRRLTGTRTNFNGIPAVTYPAGPSDGTTSQVSYVYLDGSAYELDCQWNAKHESEIKRACRQMQATIKPAS